MRVERTQQLLAAGRRHAYAVKLEPVMAKRNKDDELISVRDFEAILDEHADAICFRCKVPLKQHHTADHLFFEDPDEAPDEESN
jgi:hypothetical protein